ncbi:MAG TPA: metal-dependent transcriptional regulator [Sphingobacteriaceae bacterium]
MNSFTEENYLKAIYHLTSEENLPVSTNNIAEITNTRAASVTDMLKKLADKALINYIRYQGVTLTEKGRGTAVDIVRKHRIWEVFLVEKLGFKWDEVHDLAEELEHINSTQLIDRLDDFLGNPKVDPHGDLIPDREGRFPKTELVKLSELKPGQGGTISGVSDHAPAFLQYLEKTGLTLGRKIVVLDAMEYDGSMSLTLEGREITVSNKVANNILIVL